MKDEQYDGLIGQLRAIEERLADLGISLLDPKAPVAN